MRVLGFKPGYRTMITQVFVDDDAHLESDVVFGVTPHLIGGYTPHADGAPAPGVTGRRYALDYAFVMEPGEARLPAPPIEKSPHARP